MPIPGWEGHYEVSTQGRVLTHWNPGARRLIPSYSRILKASPDLTYGYPTVTLQREKRVRRVAVHILMMETFIGPRPEGMRDIRHLDGIKVNNSLSNLRYGTRIENIEDARLHGTASFEDKHGRRKISKSQAEEILKLCSKKVPQWRIADEYGLTQQGVSDVKNGKCWKSLDGLRKELWSDYSPRLR